MTPRQQFDAVFQTYLMQRAIESTLTKLNTPERLREAESAVVRSEAALSMLPDETRERVFWERVLRLDRERFEKQKWHMKRLKAAKEYVQWVEDGLTALTEEERRLIDLRHLEIGATGPLHLTTGAIGEHVGKTAREVDSLFATIYEKMIRRMNSDTVRTVYIYHLKRRAWSGCKRAKAKLERLTRESVDLCGRC